MNRRNAIRALIIGAPAAALSMVAAPAFAQGGYFTGEADDALIVHGLGHVAAVNNGPMDLHVVASEVLAQMRRGGPEIIVALNRNPMSRA